MENAADVEASISTRSAKRKKLTTGMLYSSENCIFCNKNLKRKKGHSQEKPRKCVTKEAELSIKHAAVIRNDKNLMRELANVDMIAQEVHYHHSCRRSYTQILAETCKSEETDPDSYSTNMQKAHDQAFQYLCNYVEDSIIRKSNIERMTMLKEIYQTFMEENSPRYYNPNYKTDKLKEKISKKFGSRLKFWQPNYKSDLVYSNDILTGEAVECAFIAAASEEKRLEEAALMLRRCVKDAFLESDDMPWPPSASFLQSEEISPPGILKHFLAYLVSGKSIEQAFAMSETFINSCSQDICYAITQGQWKMPKHVLLGMTLRHLTGSAEIVTIINHFGHCQSYSQILELETAMCNSISSSGNVLPATIDVNEGINKVLHLCWDNFDLTEETPTGAGTTHTAHGIVIQEVHEKNPIISLQTKNCRTKERSVKYIPRELSPCFMKSKPEPFLTVNTTSFATGEETKLSAVRPAVDM